MVSNKYRTSITTRLIGALQWGILGEIFANVIFGTLTSYQPISQSGIASLLQLLWVGMPVIGIVGGFLWVSTQTSSKQQERQDHKKRVEFIFGLALWGLSLTLLAPIVLSAIGLYPLPDYYITRTMSVTALIGYLGGTVFAFLLAYVSEIELYHSTAALLRSSGGGSHIE